MAINSDRSKFLASCDARLKALYSAGLSWLTYAPTADAEATAAQYRGTYQRVEVGPEFSNDGDLQQHRAGIWVKHPPVAETQPVQPPGPPLDPTPPPDEPPPPPPVPAFRIGVSLFGLARGTDAWVTNVAGEVVARQYGLSRVWFNWRRPDTSAMVVREDGSIDASLFARMKMIGAGLGTSGVQMDVTLGSESWDSDAAHIAGAAALVAGLKGLPWVAYVDVANEWNGVLSPAHVAAVIAACRAADPDRMISASVAGDPSGVLASYASLLGTGETIDLALPHFPRDSDWFHPGTRIVAIQGPLATGGITRILLQEENRIGSDGYQPKSANEYLTAAIEAREAGAEAFVFHTAAAYDPSKGSFRAQLKVPVETGAFDGLSTVLP